MISTFQSFGQLYRNELLTGVLPFWEKYSIDREQGGYFTCLDRDGSVFDTDKFVWLQGRQVWLFSMLYNHLEKRDSWIAIARHGAEFLSHHGRDPDGNWYFRLARDGRPLVQPYNIFSDCFACMAFSQYGLAANDLEAKRIAKETFYRILRRKENPKGRYDKAVPGTRPVISLSLPMILINLALELEWLLEKETLNATIENCLGEIFGLFLDDSLQVLREHVAPDGSKLDCIEGRMINPGHGIEAMWFVMDIAQRRNDRALAQKAVEVALRTLEMGWDKKLGGIFSFLDAGGRPLQQLEWDQKLWWVHIETLVAMLKGYRLTQSEACWRWFERVHDYTWTHFRDPEHGEWFGYLNRAGEILSPLKGGKWKGCFHIPRGLYLCMREFEMLSGGQARLSESSSS